MGESIDDRERLARKLGLSNKWWSSWKDSSWSLNPTPDMPQYGPGELTDILQNNHRGFSNSSMCILGPQLCPKWLYAAY